jgi:hypothetical protein
MGVLSTRTNGTSGTNRVRVMPYMVRYVRDSEKVVETVRSTRSVSIATPTVEVPLVVERFEVPLVLTRTSSNEFRKVPELKEDDSAAANAAARVARDPMTSANVLPTKEAGVEVGNFVVNAKAERRRRWSAIDGDAATEFAEVDG